MWHLRYYPVPAEVSNANGLHELLHPARTTPKVRHCVSFKDAASSSSPKLSISSPRVSPRSSTYWSHPTAKEAALCAAANLLFILKNSTNTAVRSEI